MARRRFFVERIEEGHAELSGDDAHHLARVLRVEAGQQFELADGSAAYLAEVTEVTKSRVQFAVLETLPPASPLPPLTIFAALFKFDRFEWMLEKVTELGAATLVPVETARTENGLLAAAAKRAERWRKIVRESAQQCRRVSAPEIEDARKLAALSFAGTRYRLEELPGSTGLWTALEPAPFAALGVLLGPEGGWTDAERVTLNDNGWKPVSLGSTILRSETAAVAASALVAQWWERRLH